MADIVQSPKKRLISKPKLWGSPLPNERNFDSWMMCVQCDRKSARVKTLRALFLSGTELADLKTDDTFVFIFLVSAVPRKHALFEP